jgi:hypothetical protein
MHRFVLPAIAAGVCLSSAAVAADSFYKPANGLDIEIVSDHEIYIDGKRYTSWDEVAASGAYHQHGARCGAPSDIIDQQVDDFGLLSPSDCSSSFTNISPDYEPTVARYRIPVVVHVIQSTNGTGFISESRVQSQIDILNEDIQAIPGTNGAPGTDANIEFFLATEDPQGNPTNGITYSTNNTWFNDGGSYWNTLAWDPNRYMNIYTNSASGALGYVDFIPANSPGTIGQNRDRVVVLYSSFGRNAPFVPFNLGRTGTHEIGHYLGLYHTFQSGCGTSSAPGCYSSGDRICDTGSESSPYFGCGAGRSTCGTPDPIDNYMDYSDDICMNKFTPEQVNRMRCTLLNYRTEVFQVASSGPCSIVDFAEPFGQLTFADVGAFLAAYQSGSRDADIAEPFGELTFADISVFTKTFVAGCP